jgi:acyl dehydratase
MRVFTDTSELDSVVGQELGSTEWIEIDQERVDKFADATDDHQWIHVDPARAQDGPFGGTVAHGYLTLSLIPWLSSQIFAFETPGARLNYGLNKVRFPAPLLVGKRVRATATLQEVKDLPAGKQVVVAYTITIEDGPKPACVAETVVLLLD